MIRSMYGVRQVCSGSRVTSHSCISLIACMAPKKEGIKKTSYSLATVQVAKAAVTINAAASTCAGWSELVATSAAMLPCYQL